MSNTHPKLIYKELVNFSICMGNKVIIQNNVHLFWMVRHEEIIIYFSNYISYLFNKNMQTSVLRAGW